MTPLEEAAFFVLLLSCCAELPSHTMLLCKAETRVVLICHIGPGADHPNSDSKLILKPLCSTLLCNTCAECRLLALSASHQVLLPLRRVVQAAAGVVAEVLLQLEVRCVPGKDLDIAAQCIAWALDEGYMRCIIARGLALRRAQAKLASSSLSDSIPDLGPNVRPPAGMNIGIRT